MLRLLCPNGCPCCHDVQVMHMPCKFHTVFPGRVRQIYFIMIAVVIICRQPCVYAVLMRCKPHTHRRRAYKLRLSDPDPRRTCHFVQRYFRPPQIQRFLGRQAMVILLLRIPQPTVPRRKSPGRKIVPEIQAPRFLRRWQQAFHTQIGSPLFSAYRPPVLRPSHRHQKGFPPQIVQKNRSCCTSAGAHSKTHSPPVSLPVLGHVCVPRAKDTAAHIPALRQNRVVWAGLVRAVRMQCALHCLPMSVLGTTFCQHQIIQIPDPIQMRPLRPAAATPVTDHTALPVFPPGKRIEFAGQNTVPALPVSACTRKIDLAIVVKKQ